MEEVSCHGTASQFLATEPVIKLRWILMYLMRVLLSTCQALHAITRRWVNGVVERMGLGRHTVADIRGVVLHQCSLPALEFCLKQRGLAPITSLCTYLSAVLVY